MWEREMSNKQSLMKGLIPPTGWNVEDKLLCLSKMLGIGLRPMWPKIKLKRP